MGPAEPVRPAHSAPGSAALGAGKTAAPAKRVAPATRVASPLGISRSVGKKNSSEIYNDGHLGWFHVFAIDRTQFSDRDLATLKKYWDNGMTSLGSVCREKIEAVATELNVDCEIVRTWIGNRRRKYRLMGIEVPPPRGGPADFSEQPEAGSLSALTPGEEAGPEVGEDNDRNDEVSICLSEGSSQEEPSDVVPNGARVHKEEDHHAVSTDNVKIEIIDDEESDMISNSEVEQVNSLLDYKVDEVSLLLPRLECSGTISGYCNLCLLGSKGVLPRRELFFVLLELIGLVSDLINCFLLNEEVKFIENELEIQKQKYFKLQTFVRSLVLAMKADDKEQQQQRNEQPSRYIITTARSTDSAVPRLGDSRWKSPTGRQRDSFGRHSCFASTLAQCFLVQSIQDWVSF
ncbi:Highly divergent homeobox [Plecturocebus cupreus]